MKNQNLLESISNLTDAVIKLVEKMNDLHTKNSKENSETLYKAIIECDTIIVKLLNTLTTLAAIQADSFSMDELDSNISKN